MAILVPEGGSGGDGGFTRLEGPAIRFDDIEPEYVEEVNVDLKTNTDTLTDDCGNTETRRQGDLSWNIEANGIVSEQTKQGIFASVKRNEEVFVTAEVLGEYAGNFHYGDIAIKASDDLNAISFINEATKPAYHFQVQLKEEANSN